MNLLKYILIVFLIVVIGLLTNLFFVTKNLNLYQHVFYSMNADDFRKDYKFVYPLDENYFLDSVKEYNDVKLKKTLYDSGFNLYVFLGSFDKNRSQEYNDRVANVMDILIQKGLSVYDKDDKGCNTYEHAVYNKNELAVKYLENKIADYNLLTSDKSTCKATAK